MPNGKGGFLRFVDQLQDIPILRKQPDMGREPGYVAGIADIVSTHSGREYQNRDIRRTAWKNTTARSTSTKETF